MNQNGIDIKIPDNIEGDNFLIIYKGKKRTEPESHNKEEEIIEIRTSKEDFLQKFRYFKKKNNEVEQMNEIFIHDTFYTSHFQIVVDSLKTKAVEVSEDNCNDLLSLSEKYEYHEFSSSIRKFIEERPDLERVVSTLNEASTTTTNTGRNNDEYDESEMKKEETIASHLDFFLERRCLNSFSTRRLCRIMNSPCRVVHNHHLLFEFVKETLNERGNQDEDIECLDMLIGTLDYSEMSVEEIEYIINSEYYSSVFQPRHAEEAMKTIIEFTMNNKRCMEDLQAKMKNLEDFMHERIEGIEESNRKQQEENLKQISEFEERNEKELKSAEQSLSNRITHLENSHSQRINFLDEKFSNKIADIDQKQTQNINDVDVKLTQRISELEENQNRRMNEIEENSNNKINKLEEQSMQKIKDLDEKQSNRINQLDEKQTQIIKDLDEKQTQAIANLDEKQTNKINELDERQSNKIKDLDQNLTQKINELDEKQTNKMNEIDEKHVKMTTDLDKKQTNMIKDLDDRQTKTINELDEKQSQAIKDLDERQTKTINQLDEKQTKTINELDKRQTKTISELNEKLSQSIKDLDEKQTKAINELDERQTTKSKELEENHLQDVNNIQQLIEQLKQRVEADENENKKCQTDHSNKITNIEDTHSQDVGAINIEISQITQKIKNIETHNQYYQIEQEQKLTTLEEKQLQSVKKLNHSLDQLKSKVENDEKMNQKDKTDQEQKLQTIEEIRINEMEIVRKEINEMKQKMEAVENQNKKDHEKIQIRQSEEASLFQYNMEEIKKYIDALEKARKSVLNSQLHVQSPPKIVDEKYRPFTTEISKKTEGLLGRLKKNQTNMFDKLFIASQSSGDIYNLIDPNTKDEFSIANVGEFIEIDLKDPIDIVGIQVFTSNNNFPKKFDIEIDEKCVKNIKEATELNGPNQKMTIPIDAKKSRNIKIINRGQNWDYGNNYVYIKRIEILTNDSRLIRGVFASFVAQSEDKDPHECPVVLSASKFDFSTFHLIDSQRNICTYPRENSWFQIELTQGAAILTGFRLKRCDQHKMRSYKIISTDNMYKPEEKWTTLIEINEQTKSEHKTLDIYKFAQPSPPAKYIRLIQTGPNWIDELNLIFYHFDLFGNYLI